MSATKSLCDTWTIYKTMLNLERTKFQLERTTNWYNDCGVKSLLKLQINTSINRDEIFRKIDS